MRTTAKPLLGPRAAGAYAVILALVAVGAALTAAAFVFVGVTRDAADVSVYLSDRVRLDLNDRLDLPEGATLLGNLIPVVVHVPDLPLGVRLLAQSDEAALSLSIAVGALALAQVLRTVRAGRPLARRNATWLAVVAGAVVVGGCVPPVLRDAGAQAALNHLEVRADSPFGTWSSFGGTPAARARDPRRGRGVPPGHGDGRRRRRTGVTDSQTDADTAGHRIVCRLDVLLAERGMTLTELADRAGVSVVNLSVLKNNRARAVRFSTLTAVCDALDCRALDCRPGDLLDVAARG